MARICVHVGVQILDSLWKNDDLNEEEEEEEDHEVVAASAAVIVVGGGGSRMRTMTPETWLCLS